MPQRNLVKGGFVNADDAAHFSALMLQSGFRFVSRMFQIEETEETS
jgi:hypothetical protein